MRIKDENHIGLKAFECVDRRVLDGVVVHAAFVVERLNRKAAGLRGVGQATFRLGRVEQQKNLTGCDVVLLDQRSDFVKHEFLLLQGILESLNDDSCPLRRAGKRGDFFSKKVREIRHDFPGVSTIFS